MTRRYIDIDSWTYLSTEDGNTWKLYRSNGRTYSMVATFSATESQAIERAHHTTYADAVILRDDADALQMKRRMAW